MTIFNRWRYARKRRDIDTVLDPLKEKPILRSYYLNDQKVNEFFVQQYGGLTQFTKTHAEEVASSLGVDISSDGALALLAGLKAGAEFKRSQKRMDQVSSTYEVAVLARLLLLREHWLHAGSFTSLGEVTDTAGLKPHKIVNYSGPFWFVTQVETNRYDLHPPLTDSQACAVREQQEFEKKAEGEDHYLYFIQAPILAVSIISASFITGVGFRYLKHDSGQKSETLFVGAVIGNKNDLLFMDPIVIGHLVDT